MSESGREGPVISKMEIRASRRIFSTLLLPLLALVALFLMHRIESPIRHVEFHSPLTITHPEWLAEVVRPKIQAGFWRLDLRAIQASLQEIPDIERAAIRKRWPDRVVITLFPAAILARLDDRSVLNRFGETLILRDLFEQEQTWVTVVASPEFRIPALNLYPALQASLAQLPLTIVEIRVAPEWELLLQNGVRLRLGREDVLMRLKRFANVYDKVFGAESRRVESVDLRYEHGMAVQWVSSGHMKKI